MTQRNLDALLNPKSIALIGASKRPGSVGHVLASNMMQAGFEGPIMPVNPKHEAIGGTLAWNSIAELPIIPDLAVVAVPPDAVAPVMAELNEKGCRAAVIITAGFGEGDDAEGHARLEKVLEAAGNMRILGPNILGLIVPGIGVNASFAHIHPKAGDLALVAQSGAVVTSLLDWADAKNIGFSHMVSLGDMADVDFGDMLDYLASDPKVRAILLYVEAITHARKFMSAARAAARIKPVIVMKAGRSAAAAAAAASHTGALAGSDKVYDTAFRRAGMLRVNDMHELFEAVQTVSSHMRSHVHTIGDRLGILTNGGGIGVLATDTLIERGGRLAELAPETIEKLNGVLPKTWSHANPVDIIGDADGARYKAALEILLDDPNLDAVMVVNCPQAIASSEEAADVLLDVLQEKKPRLPILTNWLGEGVARAARNRFEAAGIPSFSTPDETVAAFMHMVHYRENQEELMQVPPPAVPHPNNYEVVRDIFDRVLEEGRDILTEFESKQVLAAYDIPVSNTVMATNGDEAADRAASMLEKGPVAVKLLSRDITHKSDVGGVILNLSSVEEVVEATDHMLSRIGEAFPDARIDGVTVQPMVNMKGAHELIIGAHEDHQFGPVILFGQGGKSVEVVGDTAMALPPLNPLLAENLVKETKVWDLLKGYRDEAPADLDAIVDSLIQVSQLMIDFPDIQELDINPLLVDATGAVAVDGRVRIAKPEMLGTRRLAIKPYPKQWEGVLEGRDGAKAPIRPVRPEDAHALQELVEACDPDDIRLRFLHPMKTIPDQLAARLSQIDYGREMAFLAHESEEGDAPVIAVGRLTHFPRKNTAEYAVIVRSDQKGKGFGYAMMHLLLDYAKQSGLSSIYGEVLAENTRMLNMCRDLGFVITADPDDMSLRHVEFDLRSH